MGCFPHKKQRPAGDDTCGPLFYGGCSGITSVGLGLHIPPEFCKLSLVLFRFLFAFKGGKAVLGSLELRLGTGKLGLVLLRSSLFPVDVRTVLLHEPVQLLLGNAGDLVFYIFTLHKTGFLSQYKTTVL